MFMPKKLLIFSFLACAGVVSMSGLSAQQNRSTIQTPAKVVSSLLSEKISSSKTPEQDWEEEYAFLENEIKRVAEGKLNLERLRKEALRPVAVYDETDKTPTDIIWKRTRALYEYIKEQDKNNPVLGKLAPRIVKWKKKQETSPPANRDEMLREFKELCRIRRELSFSNRLLNFDRLVFLTHYHQRQGKGEIHIVDQYFGFNARPGGAPYVLENPFSNSPAARPLLANTSVSNGRQKGKTLQNGSFLSLELSYDAKRLYFAWTQAVSSKATGSEDWTKNFGNFKDLLVRGPSYQHYYWAPDRVYHIYRVDLDSGKLTQLTDGIHNTYDPCELPGGRVVYISEEQGGNQRCGGRWITAGVLHSMKNDGTDSYPLSFHETNEWHPSVTNDGMIAYTRWDYVDRDDCGAHHLWTCYPDGRDPRSPHGNYAKLREMRPFAEMSYRAVPDSKRLAAVSVAHHGIAYGSIILVDTNVTDDGEMSQVKRVTPEAHFMESEAEPGKAHPLGRTNCNHNSEYYGTPWPLSEDFYLCVYARNRWDHGIYLVDSFGNRELIWKDKEIPCLDPIPLRARKKPPVVPDMTTQSVDKRPSGEAPGDLADVLILNVYDTERPLPEGVKIKWLRVVNIFPKSSVFDNQPNIGMANQSLARGSLGLVPVEDDGSVYFRMPTNVNVYFQLLDGNMQAVHSMRSSTYAHSGERLTCVGCHETRGKAPDNMGGATVQALRRKQSDLMPEPDGSFPLTFPKLVQPVLDKNCVACHAKEEKAPDLDGNTFYMVKKENGQEEKRNIDHGWSKGFLHLRNWGWGRHGGNATYWHQNKFTYTVPGDVGARASKLVPFLEKGHHGVELSKDDWHRLSLWLDLNTNFYGAYENTEAQARGELVLPKFGMAKINPLTKQRNIAANSQSGGK